MNRSEEQQQLGAIPVAPMPVPMPMPTAIPSSTGPSTVPVAMQSGDAHDQSKAGEKRKRGGARRKTEFKPTEIPDGVQVAMKQYQQEYPAVDEEGNAVKLPDSVVKYIVIGNLRNTLNEDAGNVRAEMNYWEDAEIKAFLLTLPNHKLSLANIPPAMRAVLGDTGCIKLVSHNRKDSSLNKDTIRRFLKQFVVARREDLVGLTLEQLDEGWCDDFTNQCVKHMWESRVPKNTVSVEREFDYKKQAKKKQKTGAQKAKPTQ